MLHYVLYCALRAVLSEACHAQYVNVNILIIFTEQHWRRSSLCYWLITEVELSSHMMVGGKKEKQDISVPRCVYMCICEMSEWKTEPCLHNGLCFLLCILMLVTCKMLDIYSSYYTICICYYVIKRTHLSWTVTQVVLNFVRNTLFLLETTGNIQSALSASSLQLGARLRVIYTLWIETERNDKAPICSCINIFSPFVVIDY